MSSSATRSLALSANPDETLTAVVARPAYAVGAATRTMPVELDLANPGTRLTPGMYSEVSWPVRRAGETLVVPASAVKATTERAFVIRVASGRAEWVEVRRGMSGGGLVEIFGNMAAGDRVVLRATDEIRPAAAVRPR